MIVLSKGLSKPTRKEEDGGELLYRSNLNVSKVSGMLSIVMRINKDVITSKR